MAAPSRASLPSGARVTAAGGPPRCPAEPRERLLVRFEAALAARDGATGAACVHELWMRGEIGLNVERMLERLWAVAAASVPEWLPMRHVDWLATAYEVAARCVAARRGRSRAFWPA